MIQCLYSNPTYESTDIPFYDERLDHWNDGIFMEWTTLENRLLGIVIKADKKPYLIEHFLIMFPDPMP